MYVFKEGKSRLGVVGLLLLVSMVLAGCNNVGPVIESGFPTGAVGVGDSVNIVVTADIDPAWFEERNGSTMKIVSVSVPSSGPSSGPIWTAPCDDEYRFGNSGGTSTDCVLTFNAPGTYIFLIRLDVPGSSVFEWYEEHSDESEEYTIEVVEAEKVETSIYLTSVSWPGSESGGPLQPGMMVTFEGRVDTEIPNPAWGQGFIPTGNIMVEMSGATCEILPGTYGGVSQNPNTRTCELLFPGVPENSPYIFEANLDYPGDLYYGASSAIEVLEMSQIDVLVSASTSPNPSSVGEVVSMNVEVVGVTVAGSRDVLLPTGEVFFRVFDASGNVDCTVDLVPNAGTGVSTASCDTWVPSADGDYNIEVTYGGDGAFERGGTDIVHTVGKLESTTTIDSVNPPNLVQVGETAIFFVSVSGSGATPTGTVDVSGAGGSCTVTLDANGEGSCSYAMNSLGQHTIMATYSGDGDYDESSATASYGVVAPPDPDTDGDGIPDSKDSCPNQGDNGYGLEANGCPTLG